MMRLLVLVLLMLPISLFAQQKHTLQVGISDYPNTKFLMLLRAAYMGQMTFGCCLPFFSKQGFKVETQTD